MREKIQFPIQYYSEFHLSIFLQIYFDYHSYRTMKLPFNENMLNNLHTNNILMMCSTLFYFGVNIMNSIEGLKHHKLNVFLK